MKYYIITYKYTGDRWPTNLEAKGETLEEALLSVEYMMFGYRELEYVTYYEVYWLDVWLNNVEVFIRKSIYGLKYKFLIFKHRIGL